MKLPVRVFGLPEGKCWFGGRKKLPEVTQKVFKLFAFVVLPSGETTVMSYEDTPEGFEDLASLLRTGDVISVVRGEELPYAIESVVSASRPGGAYESRLTLDRGV